MRVLGARLRRRLLSLLATAAVSLPISVAGSAGIPAPAPPGLPAVGTQTLELRYDANRRAITAAEEAAADHGAAARQEALAAMARSERRFLDFDGRGAGRAVEVIGDLATADRIAVIVPGADTSLDTFDHHPGHDATLGRAARQVHREMRRLDPSLLPAVVAWLGYDTPSPISLDVMMPRLAVDAARDLSVLLDELRSANPDARVSLLCHSYGSVVCGAVSATDGVVADIAVYGSPGLGIGSADELGSSARLWAGMGGSYPIAAGDGGHSDYYEPGGAALRSLALIALGRGAEVWGG